MDERDPARTPRVLVVTNDFPPRVGGVQQYVWNLVRNLPPDRVSVLAPNWQGWREHDAAQPFEVHRWPATFLWPTQDLARRVRSLVRAAQADIVLFGHGFPLPLLAPSLGAAGIPSVVLTHGAEVWLAQLPVLAAGMRRGFDAARAVTAISRFTAAAIRPLVPSDVPFLLLSPGVDEERFSPSVDGSAFRERLGPDGGAGRQVILCVSRLVPRKGHDVLISGMGVVRDLVPGAVLAVVGGGPYEERLRRLAASAPAGSVVFCGQVPHEKLPEVYAACDLFAMPCRSRWGGLEVEGFGIVYLEAAASGKAVVAGRSGGAAEAVADEVTGLLAEGTEPKAVALAVARLLLTPDLASRMGRAGRARVVSGFTWKLQAARLSKILAQAAG
jgi:phosphatidylinositol alpha-1,6-mannosyltransferase